MVNKHIKSCSTSLLIREIQTDHSNIPLYILLTGKHKEVWVIPNVGEAIVQLEVSYTIGGKGIWYCTSENNLPLTKLNKTERPNMPLQDIYPRAIFFKLSNLTW